LKYGPLSKIHKNATNEIRIIKKSHLKPGPNCKANEEQNPVYTSFKAEIEKAHMFLGGIKKSPFVEYK
jgi:hypothetical protein